MVRIWQIIAVFFVSIGMIPSAGVWADDRAIDHAKEYRACIALTHRDAWAAYEAAAQWGRRGGGRAAQHCAALALLEAGRLDQAALQLEALAANLPHDGKPSPVDALAQAANVWLLAGRLDRARTAVDLALQAEPDHPGLLVDRARILAETADFAAALADLDRAVAIDPKDDDAAAFRASALRRLNRPAAALKAAERALSLNPENPSARLERGLLRRDRGDRDGARQDWLKVVSDHGGTPAADAAKIYLERLDLKVR
jgi:tetratricopeptide (TPR) repeat protein